MEFEELREQWRASEDRVGVPNGAKAVKRAVKRDGASGIHIRENIRTPDRRRAPNFPRREIYHRLVAEHTRGSVQRKNAFRLFETLRKEDGVQERTLATRGATTSGSRGEGTKSGARPVGRQRPSHFRSVRDGEEAHAGAAGIVRGRQGGPRFVWLCFFNDLAL